MALTSDAGERQLRIGIDVGGTFTDVFMYDPSAGTVTGWKIPSTPSDPSKAIVDGLVDVLGRSASRVQDVAYFAHGSTVATNALLEGRGASVGLITTLGFRDLLEIGRQTRPHLYDLQVEKPAPLIQRQARLEVIERMSADGLVITPIDLEQARDQVARHIECGVESLAICFLHSYKNPIHEQLVAAIAGEAAPNVFLSVSHEVMAEFREYERLLTTVVNAYVGPVVQKYVDRLRLRLDELGLQCPPHMTQSNGGIMSLELAASYPFKAVLSGPSAGVVGAAFLGSNSGAENLITVDMGGTSTDVCLITSGAWSVVSQRDVAGYPVKTPAVDVHTVGAGGGSIAWIDGGGLLKVGPRSAGAAPGPACYDRGGNLPTVTDAHVVLGTLGPSALLAGSLAVNAEKAEASMRPLAERLDKSVWQVAEGIVAVAVSNIVRAIRAVSVQRGYDPREYVLMPFGGAGPLHAGYILREMGLGRALIPPHPGLLCAFGLLATDLRADFSRTNIMPCNDTSMPEVARVFADLTSQARAWLKREGISPANSTISPSIDMRYLGQNHELTVEMAPPPAEMTAHDLLERFYVAHERAYGFAAVDEDVELVTMRLRAVGSVPRVDFRPQAVGSTGGGKQVSRRVFLGGSWVACPVYDRVALGIGAAVPGPAAIEQMDTTTVLLAGQLALVDAMGNLEIIDEGEGNL